MIMSVSMLSIGIGAATPVNVVNLSISLRLSAFSRQLYQEPPRRTMASNSQILLQVLGCILRRALDVEGLDEGAGLVHQIDDRTVVHRIVAVGLLLTLAGEDPKR